MSKSVLIDNLGRLDAILNTNDFKVKIAILGWGSLLWDTRLDFDLTHGPWKPDGPRLPLEFSRVSESRGGALTLVIDHQSGALCSCAFSMSLRTLPEEAIVDLRAREGTTSKNIGYYFADGSSQQSRSARTVAAIEAWATGREIDVVIWTDLTSNFGSKSLVKTPFTVSNALAHLQALPGEGKARAAEYIRRAPGFIDTPLRREVEVCPWFKEVDASGETVQSALPGG